MCIDHVQKRNIVSLYFISFYLSYIIYIYIFQSLSKNSFFSSLFTLSLSLSLSITISLFSSFHIILFTRFFVLLNTLLYEHHNICVHCRKIKQLILYALLVKNFFKNILMSVFVYLRRLQPISYKIICGIVFYFNFCTL